MRRYSVSCSSALVSIAVFMTLVDPDKREVALCDASNYKMAILVAEEADNPRDAKVDFHQA